MIAGLSDPGSFTAAFDNAVSNSTGWSPQRQIPSGGDLRFSEVTQRDNFAALTVASYKKTWWYPHTWPTLSIKLMNDQQIYRQSWPHQHRLLPILLHLSPITSNARHLILWTSPVPALLSTPHWILAHSSLNHHRMDQSNTVHHRAHRPWKNHPAEEVVKQSGTACDRRHHGRILFTATCRPVWSAPTLRRAAFHRHSNNSSSSRRLRHNRDQRRPSFRPVFTNHLRRWTPSQLLSLLLVTWNVHLNTWCVAMILCWRRRRPRPLIVIRETFISRPVRNLLRLLHPLSAGRRLAIIRIHIPVKAVWAVSLLVDQLPLDHRVELLPLLRLRRAMYGRHCASGYCRCLMGKESKATLKTWMSSYGE